MGMNTYITTIDFQTIHIIDFQTIHIINPYFEVKIIKLIEHIKTGINISKLYPNVCNQSPQSKKRVKIGKMGYNRVKRVINHTLMQIQAMNR